MATKKRKPKSQAEKEAELLRLAHIIGIPKALRIIRELKLSLN